MSTEPSRITGFHQWHSAGGVGTQKHHGCERNDSWGVQSASNLQGANPGAVPLDALLVISDGPPDKQEKATQTVLEQAKLLCAEWAE
jgi:hypothetical protein